MAEDDNATPETLAANLGLIAPNGPKKARWDWFMLLLVFYTSFSVPYQLAFYAFSDWNNSAFGFMLDVMINLLYILDIFISWRTTYYDREGLLVLDRKKAHRKYLKTWFPIDAFASFPFEYIGMLIVIGSGSTAPAALRLPAMVKLLRILRLGKKIDRLSSSKMFRIGQFTAMLLMAAHWYACLWFFLGELAQPIDGFIDSLPGENGTSWVYRYDMADEDTATKYASSLYWAVTTLMKSPWFHPNSPLEFVGATCMIIFGCVLFAYFLGNVTAVITAANAAGGRYRGQIEQLKSFCMSQGITPKMTDKLMVYQDALWTETNSGTDINGMIRAMPYHLLPYVLIGHIYKPLMNACPFLYDCSAWGCVEFLSSLKVQVCEKGDTLLHEGTLIGVMYILVRGEVKVDAYEEPEKEMAEQYVMGGRIGGNKKETKRKRLSAKDMMRGRTDKFGTLIGFHDVSKPVLPRQYSVSATTRVSLLMITRAQLNQMFNAFPQDKPHVIRAIEAANTAHMNQLGARRPTVRSSSDMSPDGRRGPAPTSADDTSAAGGAAEKPQLVGAEQTRIYSDSPNGEKHANGSRDRESGQWLNTLLSPPNQRSNSVELGKEILSLRSELAEQRTLIAAQSKMLEQILGNQQGLAA